MCFMYREFVELQMSFVLSVRGKNIRAEKQ